MMAAGPRNFPNNLLTRLHGAFSTSVAPPRLEINRKTIEKTWKLMDKVVMIDKPNHPIIYFASISLSVTSFLQIIYLRQMYAETMTLSKGGEAVSESKAKHEDQPLLHP